MILVYFYLRRTVCVLSVKSVVCVSLYVVLSHYACVCVGWSLDRVFVCVCALQFDCVCVCVASQREGWM